MEIAGVITGLLGALISILATAFGTEQLRRLRRKQPPEEVTLEQRLDALARTMHESARLLQQVSAEIEARAATAERLQQEAATAEQLASLNRAERDAVAELVRAEVAGGSQQSARLGVLIGTLFFVGGVAATVAVTLFVQPLYR